MTRRSNRTNSSPSIIATDSGDKIRSSSEPRRLNNRGINGTRIEMPEASVFTYSQELAEPSRSVTKVSDRGLCLLMNGRCLERFQNLVLSFSIIKFIVSLASLTLVLLLLPLQLHGLFVSCTFFGTLLFFVFPTTPFTFQ